MVAVAALRVMAPHDFLWGMMNPTIGPAITLLLRATRAPIRDISLTTGGRVSHAKFALDIP